MALGRSTYLGGHASLFGVYPGTICRFVFTGLPSAILLGDVEVVRWRR